MQAHDLRATRATGAWHSCRAQLAPRELQFTVNEPERGLEVMEIDEGIGVARRYRLEVLAGGARTRLTSRLEMRLAAHDAALQPALRAPARERSLALC